MSEHDKERANFDYQRGRRDGYNEGFSAGIKAAQEFAESRTDINLSYWLGVSSKEQEFTDLQNREARARATGHHSNAYVCAECVAEGKSQGNSTYLGWPDAVDGKTLCAQHATQLSVDPSSSTAV